MIHLDGDTSDESLERGPGEKHVYRLLVSLDLSQGHSTGLITTNFPLFHASISRCCLLDNFGTLDLVGHLRGGLGFSGNFRLWHLFLVSSLNGKF